MTENAVALWVLRVAVLGIAWWCWVGVARWVLGGLVLGIGYVCVCVRLSVWPSCFLVLAFSRSLLWRGLFSDPTQVFMIWLGRLLALDSGAVCILSSGSLLLSLHTNCG